MAVSVDTVYQRVLALANKEQRGYITPQEFNLLANQAQLTIFESYFYSMNLLGKMEQSGSNEVDESDISELVHRKLGPFGTSETVIGGHTFPSQITVDGTPCEVYQTGHIFFNEQVCQHMSINEVERMKRSTRHISSTSNQAPVFAHNRFTSRDIVVYAGSSTAETSNVTVECFRRPMPVQWGYVVVNDKALYNANVSVNFELHVSEEDTLVNSILDLSGIVINKSDIAAYATSKIIGEKQEQNQ
tara:strand:+ start:436 stop:1170 length:735 start_codon:yes stop_codon:yes gene_type:complete